MQNVKHDDALLKLTEQQKSIEAMGQALEHMSDNYDEILKTTQENKTKLKELEEKSASFDAALSEQQSEMDKLKSNLNSLEEYSRRKNIEIHGIEETVNENPLSIVSFLGVKLGLKAPTPEEIEAIHRINAKPDMTPPLLVRFSTTTMRDSWLSKRLALKSDDIYINENLTAYTKRLLWMAKSVGKEKSYKFVWARNGKVFMKKQEGMAAMKIVKDRSLLKLL